MWFTVAGRYQRREKIADGGSGTLYRAMDTETGDEVALKCFYIQRAFDTALIPALRGTQTLCRALGPHVLVPLLDVGTDEDGTPYAIMPLLKGETLASRVLRPLLAHESEAIAQGVAVAVEALRSAGFTHGDLSAENVFVLRGGGVVLLDHESVGRIGTPRPQRHTEGVPDLAEGLREARDDAHALTQLELLLQPAPKNSFRARWVMVLLLIAFTGIGLYFLVTR